ncbi:MAG: short-chain dehydrogenase/reductase [Nocardioidaceae bacterium]|nr:short-chain dehydrogenase/reductase [Nocardioidaceae bacterium]
MKPIPDTSPVPNYRDMLALAGRGFVVAGAGQGIGRQTAHALASAGAKVLCVDVVEEFAQQVAAEVGGVALVADMCERSGVQEALDLARASFGALAGIVDIIGMSNFKSIAETDDEDWEHAQRINLRHAFLLAQMGSAALAGDGGGSLVFIASVTGLNGAPRNASYGAAKAGLISLVKTAAVEFGPLNVRTNAIAPGLVWTPRLSAQIGEERRAYWAKNAPLDRVALPQDIAAAALFLSSDLASFVSGQVLTVDGGTSRKYPYPIDTL